MQIVKKRISVVLPFLGLILVIAALGILSGGDVFKAANIRNILDQCYTIVILSVACSFIYAHGGFDLAVGGVFGLSMMLSGLFILSYGGTIIALPICIAVTLVCNLIVAVVTTKLKLPAFITSLCMQFLCRGAVTTISNGNINLPSELSAVNSWGTKVVVLVVLVAGAYILMHHTPFGRHNSAIGENPTAARQSGINVDRTRVIAYVIAAVLIGVAAFFAMSRTLTVATLAGSGYEMDVIVAIVLGGMSLNGGTKSSVRSPIVGALLVVILTNGLVIIGVNYKLSDLLIGVIFLIVIMFSYKRNKLGLLPR